MKNSRKKSDKSKSQIRSDASRKGWITRRLNETKSKSTRTLSSEKLKKLQQEEKIRNKSRRIAQKKGKSLSTDKPKLKLKKPTRPARRQSKKRASIR